MNCKQTRASSVTDPRTRRRLERDNNRPPTPPPPLPPPAVAIDTTPPSFTCDNCGKVILSTADHIIIRPCTHTLCTFCAFNSHVQRGIAHHTCPVTVCNRITDEEGSEVSARRAVVHFENQLKVCEAFDMVDGIATAKSNIAIAKSKYKSGNSGELLKTSRELYDWCVATHGVGNEYTILAGNTYALELAKESRWRESRELLMKSTRFTPQYNKGN